MEACQEASWKPVWRPFEGLSRSVLEACPEASWRPVQRLLGCLSKGLLGGLSRGPLDACQPAPWKFPKHFLRCLSVNLLEACQQASWSPVHGPLGSLSTSFLEACQQASWKPVKMLCRTQIRATSSCFYFFVVFPLQPGKSPFCRQKLCSVWPMKGSGKALFWSGLLVFCISPAVRKKPFPLGP